MFEPLLWNLRDQGLSVGLGEWRAFLTALERGLAGSVDELYHVGRSILVHSEAHYDLYDVAFARTFAGLVSDPRLVKALEAWLKDPKAFDEARAAGQHDFRTIDELLEAMKKTMEQQHERTAAHLLHVPGQTSGLHEAARRAVGPIAAIGGPVQRAIHARALRAPSPPTCAATRITRDNDDASACGKGR